MVLFGARVVAGFFAIGVLLFTNFSYLKNEMLCLKCTKSRSDATESALYILKTLPFNNVLYYMNAWRNMALNMLSESKWVKCSTIYFTFLARSIVEMIYIFSYIFN